MMQDSMLACPRSLVWMLALVLSLLCTNALEANDFVWDGACGSNEWYATCSGDLCESNPDRYWVYNNWGEASCGGTPAFPGESDNVLLPQPGVVLNNIASLAQLTIYPGSGLTVSGQAAVLMPHGGVTNEGQLVIQNGATLVLDAIAFNFGTIGLYDGALLRFDTNGDFAYVSGGAVCLESAEMSNNGEVRFVNGPGQTIHGHGTLNVAMRNDGLIVADRPGHTLTINPQGLGVANAYGRMEVQSGCNLTINDGSHFWNSSEIVVDGLLSVNDGALRLGAGTLTGSGIVAGDVVNVEGTVAPGAASTAVLSISGNYAQGAEGQLDIQLGGTGAGIGYDRLAVGGHATLCCVLRVSTTNGFNPVPGQEFVIVTAATVTGSYGQTFPSGENFAYKTVYSQHDVTLVISTPRLGDLNCDDQINFRDINPFVLYLASLSSWRSEYPACPPQNGDINADGTYPSFGDINPFVALLSGG